MAVTKRIRFEVLRRDSHTCRYCGRTAPDVGLTVDHVTPVALGGTDDPSNLVAACRDCNYGKASTTPDSTTVAQVSEAALQWAEAVKLAGKQMLAAERADKTRHDWFLDEWKQWDGDGGYLPDGWAKSVDAWLNAGLPKASLIDCLDIALGNRGVRHYDVFAYMGGIARKKIEKLHAAAQAIVAERGATDGS